MAKYRGNGERAAGRRVGMRIFLALVTAALIVELATSVAAKDAVHEDAVAQRVQVGQLNGRPAAPQLLSVEIVPDAPANGTGLRMEKGAGQPIAVPAERPLPASIGAGR